MKKICKKLVQLLFMMTLASTVHAEGGKHEGEILYYKHLCNHCHGTDGANPKDEIVPKLKGKDAAFLKQEARAILDGTRKGKAVVMHAKYYSSEATSGACDTGPKNEELDKIAAWLAIK
ncbi:MAG: c-type cytochrome [Magnetococcales bacterium]|nr:c-type cytochrome [Magnetococcales bacterium]